MIKWLLLAFILISLYSGYVETDRIMYNIESMATLSLLSFTAIKTVNKGQLKSVLVGCFALSLLLFFSYDCIDKIYPPYDKVSQFIGCVLLYIILINVYRFGFIEVIVTAILALALFELLDEIRNKNNEVLYWGDLLLNIIALFYLLWLKLKKKY